MESEGGGIAAATAPITQRLSSQHSTLHDSLISSDIDNNGLNTTTIVNHNSNPTSPRPISNLTLGTVLNGNKKPSPPNNVVVRTLLEIIRNDETLNTGGGSPNSKKSWKSFKEKLTRKKSKNQNSGRWVSSMPVPQSDVLPSSRSGRDLISNRNSLRNSLRNNSIRRIDGVPADDVSLMEVDSGGSPRSGGSFRLSAALAAEREETRRRLSRELDEDGNEDEVDVTGLSTQKKGHDDEDDDEDEDDEDEDEEEDDEAGLNFGGPTNQPMRMSLMDLLEETDRQAGIDGPTYRLDDEEEDDEEEVEEEEEDAVEEELGKGEYSCCVCMVRHKGSAFIPCGHTFCRLCSKELFVQKGNCPLCNNFILEILDIF